MSFRAALSSATLLLLNGCGAGDSNPAPSTSADDGVDGNGSPAPQGDPPTLGTGGGPPAGASTGPDDAPADPTQSPTDTAGTNSEVGPDPTGPIEPPVDMNPDQTGSPSDPPGQTLPPISDYGARGPFATLTVNNTGPNGQYTMFRPETLGENGFKHPPTTWGNGITTTPPLYDALLSTIASHGFVVIASNSAVVNAQLMTAGLDWLLEQNDVAGELSGMLDPTRAVSIGYSLGGGAAVETGKHPNVVTTVSFHGLTGNSAALHGPLLLFTGTADDFVSASQFVDPTFNRSAVPTFYATLTGADHLRPLGDAGDERAPTIAWLRMLVYGDQDARRFFYGDDCVLCQSPWTNPQTKDWQ